MKKCPMYASIVNYQKDPLRRVFFISRTARRNLGKVFPKFAEQIKILEQIVDISQFYGIIIIHKKNRS